MSRTTRTLIILTGLLLVAVSIAALAYALAPVSLLHDLAPVEPTLLALPGGGIP